MSAFETIKAALAKAQDRLANPEDEKKPGAKPGAKPGEGAKPGDDKKPDFLKAGGKVKGVAERLLSTAKKMEESGKSPDAETVRKLRAMMNELGSAIDGCPSPKRTAKSISMTPTEFSDHAASEIERAVTEQDADRLSQVQTNVESVAWQMADDDVEKIRVDVFEDPAQRKTETVGGADTIKSLQDQIGELSQSIQSLKAKKPPDEEDKAKPGDEDEETKAKAKKAADEEAAKQNQCPECKAMNKEGAIECAKCGAKLAAKTDTKKADTSWPADMNKGRKRDESEGWGEVKKSASDDDRSFGPDPAACRE